MAAYAHRGGATGHGRCGSYDPGHQLHWQHWKQAAAGECLSVLEVSQDGTSLEIRFENLPSVHWHHHDPDAVAHALLSNRGPIVASPSHQALRVDGFWFNCATDAAAFTHCA